MNIGSFVTNEKETYGIFFDDCAQSVTDNFIREYKSRFSYRVTKKIK